MEKVFLCVINFLVSWHDGSITDNILPYTQNHIGNYKVCVHQGFPRSADAVLILVGPITLKQAQTLAHDLCPYLLWTSIAYVSLHQASY
jgi:hypothetical protein